MTIDDAISLVKNDDLSISLNEYRIMCRLLADEVCRLREQIKEDKNWSEGFELGRKDAVEDYHQTLDMFTSEEDALDILKTYLRLHEGKVGAHWLWSAIERIAMGEDELQVLEDYGYIRDGFLATKYHQVKRP